MPGPRAHLARAGSEILARFDGHDATAAFFSLHSKDAVARLRRMRPVEAKHTSAPAVDHHDKGAPGHAHDVIVNVIIEIESEIENKHENGNKAQKEWYCK